MTISRSSNGPTPRFHNKGTLSFVGDPTGGPDANGARNIRLDNDGVLQVLSGDVSLLATGTSTGSWIVGGATTTPCSGGIGQSFTSDARLFLRPSPSFDFPAGSMSGPGCLTLFGGIVGAGASTAWSPEGLEVFGGTLRLAGNRTLPPVRIGNGGRLDVNGGTATASGSIAQTSTTQFMQFGGNGRLVVPAGVPFVHTGGNGLQFHDQLRVEFAGTLATTASIQLLDQASVVSRGEWTVGPTSTVNIEAGATLRPRRRGRRLDDVRRAARTRQRGNGPVAPWSDRHAHRLPPVRRRGADRRKDRGGLRLDLDLLPQARHHQR
jgi:hypothetical protein